MSMQPSSRWEAFMAKIAGTLSGSISPSSRAEGFYNDIADRIDGLAAAQLPTDIDDPEDGQTLVYDATDDVWKNVAASGGGALVVNATYDEETSTSTLDKTWNEINNAAALGPVWIVWVGDTCSVEYLSLTDISTSTATGNTHRVVTFWVSDGAVEETEWVTDDADGYPSAGQK